VKAQPQPDELGASGATDEQLMEKGMHRLAVGIVALA
jgi:hypothetical protein